MLVVLLTQRGVVALDQIEVLTLVVVLLFVLEIELGIELGIE